MKAKYVTPIGGGSVTVVDNLNSTSATDALSAKQGRLLAADINTLKSIGRFLSIWNAATGLPVTDPTALPYTYKTGDYYIVGTVADGGGSNYYPNGSTYNGTASATTVPNIAVGDWIFYDGQLWKTLSGAIPGMVRADIQQSFTSSEKLQARSNIGAQEQVDAVSAAEWPSYSGSADIVAVYEN